MLVLRRKPGEEIVIGQDVVVRVLETHGNRVQIGIAAPAAVSIRRAEVERQLSPPTGPAPSSRMAAGDPLDHNQPVD